ncbi:uncharacterized protein RSE6_09284 [Rhynchosporium secalis]|uniref:Uncharacterized protein n=1 Tax=Rhynchosporium secalis TaxID=38038 RepID=A0A1E1MHJ1_RHYSE|nr:uncharacterized protein RSE6_09284 [Rhynchosporium secalis]
MTRDELISIQYATRSPRHDFEKPFQIASSFPGEYTKSNIDFTHAVAEVIHDLRGSQDAYGIDSHGFAVIEHYSAMVDWSDKEAIEKLYLPEVEKIMTAHLDNVNEVYFFNWRVRLFFPLYCLALAQRYHQKRKNRPYKDEGIQEIDMNDGSQYVLPADFVHFADLHKDHSPVNVVELVQRYMGARAVDLLRGRVRVINFWKPISPYPIQDAPLALCDGTSVTDADFMTADHVRIQIQGETRLLLYRPGFRWHYLSDQEEHEGYLIKIFDSLKSVPAQCKLKPNLDSGQWSDFQAINTFQPALTLPFNTAIFLLGVLQEKA